jgi:hypothetical protein
MTDLSKVDELLHIGKQMRRIALQSAIGAWYFRFHKRERMVYAPTRIGSLFGERGI